MSTDFNDPARAYRELPTSDGRDSERGRFAPANNLYDAIRADMKTIGGVDFVPLLRESSSELPFNDIDWNPQDE